MSTTPTHIIWNAAAGSAEANAESLTILRNRGDVTVHQPESGDEVRAVAKQASELGATTVVAAGGDGTVNAVVNGLLAAGCQSTLAVLPLGTGNDFSRTIAMPLDIQQAIELIDFGERRRIDVVQARSGSKTIHYINMATGGNTGIFLDRLTDDMKHFWGPLVYLRGVVDVLSELVSFDVTVSFDDGPPQSLTALNVFVANGRTSGTGLHVAPDASLEDNLLDIVIILDCEPMQLAALATDYVVSDYRNNENVVYRRARRVVIDSSPTMAFSADGDLLAEGRVEFRTSDSKLSVIVGPDYAAAPSMDVATA